MNEHHCYECGQAVSDTWPGPLGVESWRLLFRAHRDGWELLTEHRPDELGPERCRWWHNANTGQVFAFTTVEVR